MRASKTENTPETFHPYTLSIHVDTLADHYLMMRFWSMNVAIPDIAAAKIFQNESHWDKQVQKDSSSRIELRDRIYKFMTIVHNALRDT